MKSLRFVLCAVALVSAFAAKAQTLRVDGEGYLRLALNGQVVYAKSIKVARINGRLGDENGATFLPAIECPSAPSSLKVGLDGIVWCNGQAIGKLVLAQFKLTSPVAEGKYLVTQNRPELAEPGEGTAGVIRFEGIGGGGTAPSVAKPTPRTETKHESKPAPNTKGMPLSIKVRSVSEVNTEKYTLGQIADIKGDSVLAKVAENLAIGDTPPIGIDRVLDGVRISGALRQAGFDVSKLTLNVQGGSVVRRESQNIPLDDLIDTAVNAADATLGKNGTLRSSGPLQPVRVPKGQLELVCTQVNEMQGQVRCTVDIYVEAKKFNAVTVLLTREGAKPKLMVGATVTVRAIVGALVVETTGKVTKIGAKATDPVEVKTSDGATLVGTVNSRGEVEVAE